MFFFLFPCKFKLALLSILKCYDNIYYIKSLCYFLSGTYLRLNPNVAPTGIATQSETHIDTDWAASPFVVSHANDGNFNTSMTQTYCACTYTEPTPSVWWQVDLLELYQMTAVTEREEWRKWNKSFS